MMREQFRAHTGFIEEQLELGRLQKAVDVLDDEDIRLGDADDPQVFTPELVARVVDIFRPQVGEALAGRTADH